MEFEPTPHISRFEPRGTLLRTAGAASVLDSTCSDDADEAEEADSEPLEAFWPYSSKFPPVKYMHGYCAGAPGTGIVVNRIMEEGRGDARAQTIARMARQSIDALPLMPFDHLCCGSSAVAEYYLSVGDREAAGRILGTICEHDQYGVGHQDSVSNASGSAVATLFNGVCGIGYELLRYAYPETMLSVL